MTKKEREVIRRLAKRIHDDMPLEPCSCDEDDGEECDRHWALRKLGDIADGEKCSEVIV